ncbi:MAG: RDD family protein [Opitutaceae bacterium]|nr:RDD family protein [Verrucomicrobiales bacterium]
METSYKIIGGDGREYGPASLDELKAWIREGRVGHATQVWRSDNTIWAAAEQFQELGFDLGQIHKIPPIDSFGGLETVGFWPRLGAYLLDQIVLFGLSFLIFETLMGITPLGTDPNTMDWAAFGRRMAIDTVLALVYYTAMTGQFGATVGKIAIGVRVVRMDGSPIGFGLAALRFFASILSSITLCVGYLMIAFRADHRSLHDLIVGTQVVYKR